MSPSIADQAIAALSAVQRMDEGIDLEHPERHAVRELKRAAEQAMLDAFRLATSLAFTAQTVREVAKELQDNGKGGE